MDSGQIYSWDLQPTMKRVLTKAPNIHAYVPIMMVLADVVVADGGLVKSSSHVNACV